jgi:hypothetical protein
LLQLSGAWVQAFQATWCLVGAEDIAEQQTRYIRALNAVGIDADGAKFMRLFCIYKEMLMGPLFSSTVWIAKARLFRVVLSYDFDAGGWEASSALAERSRRAMPSRHRLRLVGCSASGTCCRRC